MRFRVLKSHGLGGGKYVEEGDILELEPGEAERKVGMGYIAPAPEPAAPPAEEELDGEDETEGEAAEAGAPRKKGKRG